MKIIGKILIAFLVAPMAHGTEVLWLKLTPNFTYKDISAACSNFSFPKTLYFGAEVHDGQVILAVLKDSTFEPLSRKISFSKEELSAIDLHEDVFGRFWIKNLGLSARLLGWVFENSSESLVGCRPSQPLKTISPAPYVFAFNVEGLGEPNTYSESQLGTFKGQRQDGAAYVATVQWGQGQYEVSRRGNYYRSGSLVFATRQDCQAMAYRNPGLCSGQDCRGVLYKALSYCRSPDCKAMAQGLVGLCQTRDCRAYVYDNVGFCESANCRAVLYGNAGLCH